MTTTPDSPGPSPTEPPPPRNPSVGQLISTLSEQIARLVRAEIDLAKAELAEKFTSLGIGAVLLGGAGVVGLFAVPMLLTVLVLALSEAFAPWLAALIVFGVMLLVIAALVIIGVKKVKQGAPPTPEKAIAGIKEDVEAVKGSIKGSTKEEEAQP